MINISVLPPAACWRQQVLTYLRLLPDECRAGCYGRHALGALQNVVPHHLNLTDDVSQFIN
ncbi:hypothetical protein FD644_07665 [Serratia fonticola]|uniref:hypothetical protein n=1 Tax=Serratia fonticola TaxID=47917 RepID=UPI0010CD41FA|nr:hypothetical protein [Serratia fonticola]MBC3249414.1 hypothetical protein [Serratia fonticola]QCR60237.1 hypothetical protein FD644_07665 [Serratia fonticola]